MAPAQFRWRKPTQPKKSLPKSNCQKVTNTIAPRAAKKNISRTTSIQVENSDMNFNVKKILVYGGVIVAFSVGNTLSWFGTASGNVVAAAPQHGGGHGGGGGGGGQGRGGGGGQ